MVTPDRHGNPESAPLFGGGNDYVQAGARRGPAINVALVVDEAVHVSSEASPSHALSAMSTESITGQIARRDRSTEATADSITPGPLVPSPDVRLWIADARPAKCVGRARSASRGSGRRNRDLR